jgi:hypothetical protein
MKLLIMYLFFHLSAFAIPISITKNSDLNFGSIVAGSTTKVIAPGSSENSENASFTIQGDPNVLFNIILPNTTTLFLNGSGPQSLQVNTFVSNPANSGSLNVSGIRAVYVGASLNVPLTTTRGNYSGAFTVEVVY